MRQLSGIKVFLFGFLCYVALTVFLTLFFWGLNNGVENLNLYLCSSFGNNRVGIEKSNTESLPYIRWEAFVENRE